MTKNALVNLRHIYTVVTVVAINFKCKRRGHKGELEAHSGPISPAFPP